MADRYRKRLDEDQLAALLGRAPVDSPLYLHVAIEELRVFAVYERVSERIERLPPTTVELFAQVLSRIEGDVGTDFLRPMLQAIACSPAGISEFDLLGYVEGTGSPATLPRFRWVEVLNQLRPYMRPTSPEERGVLAFFHRQLNEAVIDRYLSQQGRIERVHSRLADYYRRIATSEGASPVAPYRTGQRSGVRRAPYHLMQAGRLQDAAVMLTDFSYWMARVDVDRPDALLHDLGSLRRMLDRGGSVEGISLDADFEAFLRERVHLLLRGSQTWPASRILLARALEHGDDSPVTEAAERRMRAPTSLRGHEPHLRLRSRPRTVRSNQLVAVLEGHAGRVRGVATLADGRLASWSDDSTARLWTHDGKPAAILTGHDASVCGVLETPDAHLATWDSDGTIRLWYGNGEPLASIRALRCATRRLQYSWWDSSPANSPFGRKTTRQRRR